MYTPKTATTQKFDLYSWLQGFNEHLDNSGPTLKQWERVMEKVNEYYGSQGYYLKESGPTPRSFRESGVFPDGWDGSPYTPNSCKAPLFDELDFGDPYTAVLTTATDKEPL